MSRRRALPVVEVPLVATRMAPEAGVRDELCVHYRSCLVGHIRAHSKRGGVNEVPASCPAACRWRERVELRIEDYASAGGGALAAVGSAR